MEVLRFYPGEALRVLIQDDDIVHAAVKAVG
jgi:hypothetical protein